MGTPKHERATNRFFAELVVFAILTIGVVQVIAVHDDVQAIETEPPKPVIFAESDISDVMMAEPPAQKVSPWLKEQIDKEVRREWEADAPGDIAEPVGEPESADYGMADSYDSGYYEEEAYSGYDPSGEDYITNFKGWGVGSDGTYNYTWYSQNVLPGGALHELNANGRHVGDNEFIYDGDGYIAVAMDGVEMGTVVSTPWGDAKVYDRVNGGEYTGHVDVYTNY